MDLRAGSDIYLYFGDGLDFGRERLRGDMIRLRILDEGCMIEDKVRGDVPRLELRDKAMPNLG
jgi:hypothetical protein